MNTEQREPNDLSLKLEPLDAELQIFHCSYPSCGYKNKREDDVARHERSHNPSFKWDFSCVICHENFGSLISFLRHMSSQHGDKPLCPLCKFQALDLTHFKRHMLSHTFTFNSVPKINNKQPKEPDLKLEDLDDAQEIQTFSCSYPNCGFKDKRKDQVARHEKSHDPSSKWDLFCRVCPESFTSVVSFLHHMSTGHGDKLLCPLCQFRGRDWTEFKPHVLTHTLTSDSVPTLSKNISSNVATVLRCAICSIIFTTKEDLSGHLKKCCRKIKPLRSSANKKKKTRVDDNSQESCEHFKLTEESGRCQREEISNSGSGGSSVTEESAVESILGL